MKMKEHFTKMAAFHVACAKAHAACSSAHQAMHEDSQKIVGGNYHDDLAQCHRALKEAHVDAGEHCIACAKSLEGHDDGGLNIDDLEVETETRRGGSDDIPVGNLNGPGKAAGNPWDETYRKARSGAATGSHWDPNALQPTAVQAVHGGGPLRAVPRFGAPQIDATGVPPEFQKLVED